MWAVAQRESRPAEYGWRPLLNARDQIAKISLWCNLRTKNGAPFSATTRPTYIRNLAVMVRKKRSLTRLF